MNNNLKDPLIHYFLDKPEVIAIYLFGSRATGKADHSSDVDIGILLDTKDQAKQTRRRKQYMLDLANILKKDIHPVILNYAGEELMRQIFTHGKCILVKDQKKLSLLKWRCSQG